MKAELIDNIGKYYLEGTKFVDPIFESVQIVTMTLLYLELQEHVRKFPDKVSNFENKYRLMIRDANSEKDYDKVIASVKADLDENNQGESIEYVRYSTELKNKMFELIVERDNATQKLAEKDFAISNLSEIIEKHKATISRLVVEKSELEKKLK